jgi:hypothetical protein
MKKRLYILFILFALCTSQFFPLDNSFDKELQDFVKLVRDNAGWYFYQWHNGIYMDMYYIDIGFEQNEKLYYIKSQCYQMDNFKEKKMKISSRGGHPYLRNQNYLNEEKESFVIKNGKVVSIKKYSDYLIKTDCKTQEEAAAYLFNKIDERMSHILGKHYDEETGVSINVSRNDLNFNVELTNKNGTTKVYNMRYWDSYSLFASDNNNYYFIQFQNGSFVFLEMDEYERITSRSTFAVHELAKPTKSIETETRHKSYGILSEIPKSFYMDTWDLKYNVGGQVLKALDVYRLYEKDGWKRLDFEDKKNQIIDGEQFYFSFEYTADSLKNDKSLSEKQYVKKIDNPEDFNGYMVKNLKASSSLKDKYHTYSVDGMLTVYEKKTTAPDSFTRQTPKFWLKDNVPWVEGKDGDGIGECFEFDLYPNKDYRFTRYEIRILNGYVNPLLPHLFKENNRIKTALVETDKGYKAEISFEDVVEFTEFFIPMVKDGPTHVKITIKEVYKGTKYSDTAVTALEVNHMFWDK